MIHQQMHLSDYVDELTRAHTHREPYTYEMGRTTFEVRHTTTVPPLLHQLQYASPSGRGEELGGGGYESRPAASLDSIDALTQIDLEASQWLKDLGQLDPVSTIACVSRLGSLAPRLDRCGRKPERGCCTFHEVERDIRHWWARARVMTGWDSPAWRPDNTCPMCDARGSLRIRLVDRVGLCTECRDTWDETTISHLADHIRSESAQLRPRPGRVFCWCPWPRPAVEAWPSLCPACASPWCHRAGWAVALEGPTASPEHSFSRDEDGRMGA